jgi:hypothetical protein
MSGKFKNDLFREDQSKKVDISQKETTTDMNLFSIDFKANPMNF